MEYKDGIHAGCSFWHLENAKWGNFGGTQIPQQTPQENPISKDTSLVLPLKYRKLH